MAPLLTALLFVAGVGLSAFALHRCYSALGEEGSFERDGNRVHALLRFGIGTAACPFCVTIPGEGEGETWTGRPSRAPANHEGAKARLRSVRRALEDIQ
jgi:hypothetical protein